MVKITRKCLDDLKGAERVLTKLYWEGYAIVTVDEENEENESA